MVGPSCTGLPMLSEEKAIKLVHTTITTDSYSLCDKVFPVMPIVITAKSSPTAQQTVGVVPFLGIPAGSDRVQSTVSILLCLILIIVIASDFIVIVRQAW